MRRALVLSLISILIPLSALAVERSDVPDQYKWDRTQIFASDAAWAAAKDKVAARIPEIAKYQGRLGESAATLYEALSTLMDVRLEMDRMSVYANMLGDEDSRLSEGVEMTQSARMIQVKLGTASSYIQPELIALGEKAVMGMVDKDPRLEDFRHYLADIVRWAPYTRNPEVEKILSQAGNIEDAGAEFHSTFTNAELPYPQVTLSSGETVTLDASGYTKYRSAPDREDRIKVFQSFWENYQNYRRSLAASLYAQVKTHIFNKDVRGFESCVQASLFNNNVPVSVYKQLIEDVHANLPTLHRYLKLKETMLGLDHIGYEDLYTSSVKKVDLRYTPEEAVDLCIRSNQALGDEYVNVLSGAFDAGWMDVMPNTGKRSGAYSTMVYGVHPYQLMNFNGDYESVSTMAHESGHSMHSYLAAEHQPYVTSDYSIFVAEVASTLNENLLFYSMLNDAKNKDEKLFILGSALENFRTTVFRQTMFGEFELAIHEMAEAGRPLTGDNLNALYLDLVRTYYGHDEGVCNVDSLYSVEWAYIPHFYYNFYVFQYATSLVAGTSLAKGIRDEAAEGEGKTAKRDAYLAMLSAGSSKYPVDNLKDAGVDMTTSKPFAAAMAEMNGIMDRMETLIGGGAGGTPGSGN
jgi:oligoendopeptidase F